MKWLFWVSLAVVAYIYFGYPAWLFLRTSWRKKQVQRADFTPSISIVMVVRNEEKVLAQKLQSVTCLDYPRGLIEMVVVSDGSNDGTAEILSQYTDGPRTKVIAHCDARGKAAGLNEAIQSAHGEIVVFTDARQKIEPGALRRLAENFADPEVGCASGELMLGDCGFGRDEAGHGAVLANREESQGNGVCVRARR